MSRPAGEEAKARSSAVPTTVRPVRREDLARLWELVLQLAEYERLTDTVSGSQEELGAALLGKQPMVEGLVAEQAGRITGYALFYVRFSSFRTCPRLWLEDLYVEPERRGSGAGQALLREVARVALERRCDRVDWAVLDWNDLAIGFYRRLGAEAVRSDWLQFGLDEPALRSLVATGETP